MSRIIRTGGEGPSGARPASHEPGRRGRIVLRSDNPEQPDIEVDEDGESQDQRYAVIAEFVQVLNPPLEWITSALDSLDE